MAKSTKLGPSKSIKHLMIDKANARVVLMVSIAAFLLVFSLVASRTLWNQASYQAKVIGAKQKASDQLKKNIEAMDKLKPSYDAFVGTTTNVIGGSTFGVDVRDGDNAKIVLDALPSKYDFPALTTNMETLVNDQGVGISSISGFDDEVAQSENLNSPNPSPVEMPFDLTVSETDYGKVQAVIGGFERSIRPIKIQTVDIAGPQDKLTLKVKALTYYQPAKSLALRSEVVKQ